MISPEKNVQIIVSLLKQSGIKQVVVSPGNTNVSFVLSVQEDPFFTVTSVVDERSAAYLACGISQVTGEPVVISCTGATASRNYMPGLTEAYYRGLPVMALTSTQTLDRVGHLIPQVINRSQIPLDVVKYSAVIPVVTDKKSERQCELLVNNALNTLTADAKGPVHLNLPTVYEKGLVDKLTYNPKRIKIYNESNIELLELKYKTIGIFIGSFEKLDAETTAEIDHFCEQYNACVFFDKTSCYKGNFGVPTSLLGSQKAMDIARFRPDLIIHIGKTSGDYFTPRLVGNCVWRISDSDTLEDTFGKLQAQFSMTVKSFFSYFNKEKNKSEKTLTQYYNSINKIDCDLREKIPEIMPLSNLSVAQAISPHLSGNEILHFGILNSLRCWNFINIPKTIDTYSNVGGFGIDGPLSTAVGSAIATTDRINICILGDLAFFYDLNILGNYNIPNNLRVVLVNNGTGVEFRQKDHHAKSFGELGRINVSAEGHNGYKSPQLLPKFVQTLGFEYRSADSHESLNKSLIGFLELTNKPIILEVFTNEDDEVEALDIITSLISDIKGGVKKIARGVKSIIKTSR